MKKINKVVMGIVSSLMAVAFLSVAFSGNCPSQVIGCVNVDPLANPNPTVGVLGTKCIALTYSLSTNPPCGVHDIGAAISSCKSQYSSANAIALSEGSGVYDYFTLASTYSNGRILTNASGYSKLSTVGNGC